MQNIGQRQSNYNLTHNTPQILLKIVSSDEQKQDLPQKMLKIVSSDEQKQDLPQKMLKIVMPIYEIIAPGGAEYKRTLLNGSKSF